MSIQQQAVAQTATICKFVCVRNYNGRLCAIFTISPERFIALHRVKTTFNVHKIPPINAHGAFGDYAQQRASFKKFTPLQEFVDNHELLVFEIPQTIANKHKNRALLEVKDYLTSKQKAEVV